MIQINGKSYELIQENRNGWDIEAFKQRYSDVLERYDYIIGDWGYNQLRLKGFYRDNHPKVNRDTSISGIVDYINEYCNFGCPYFVLQRVKDVAKDLTLVPKDHQSEEGSADLVQVKEARPPEANKESGKRAQSKSNKAASIEVVKLDSNATAEIEMEETPSQSSDNAVNIQELPIDELQDKVKPHLSIVKNTPPPEKELEKEQKTTDSE
nr:YutD family protein [Paenibacillus shirakamiensis]